MIKLNRYNCVLPEIRVKSRRNIASEIQNTTDTNLWWGVRGGIAHPFYDSILYSKDIQTMIDHELFSNPQNPMR